MNKVIGFWGCFFDVRMLFTATFYIRITHLQKDVNLYKFNFLISLLLCGISMALETMAQRFFHCVSYDALLMESVHWIMGFKSSDGSLSYQEVKLYHWPALPVIKLLMCEVKHRGEVKWKSKNLVQKNRKKTEIWSVFKEW